MDLVAGLRHPIHDVEKLAFQAFLLHLADAAGHADQLRLFGRQFIAQLAKLLFCCGKLGSHLLHFLLPLGEPLFTNLQRLAKLLAILSQVLGAFLQNLAITFAFFIAFAIFKQLSLQQLNLVLHLSKRQTIALQFGIVRGDDG
ncbi:hypothetical protein D3C81_952550 [compost metagenome]